MSISWRDRELEIARAERAVIESALSVEEHRQKDTFDGNEYHRRLVALSINCKALLALRRPRDPIQAVREWVETQDFIGRLRLLELLSDLERERKGKQ